MPTFYWQDDERVPDDLRRRYKRESDKLAHLQIHAAMMLTGDAIKALAQQQNLVFEMARAIAAYIK